MSTAIEHVWRQVRNVYSQDPRLLKWKGDFDALLLSEHDIRRLYSIFRRIDVDSGGTIDIMEMFMFLDIERTPFTVQVFSIMDEDNSGSIDFREFVISLWNYCTLGDEALALFAFDLYDKDCSNELEIAEIGVMLKNLYGSNFESNKRAQKLYSQMRLNPLLKFGPFEFRDYAKSHPALFFPAFAMQSLLQRKLLGKAFWKSHADKRLSKHGPSLRLKDVLAIHTKPNDVGDDMINDAMLPALSNILQLTNTRVHRAENRKEREREERKKAHNKVLERQALKRQEMLDEIINKCTSPGTTITPYKESANDNPRPTIRKLTYWKSENHINRDDPYHQSEVVDEGNYDTPMSPEDQRLQAAAARKKAEEKWEMARQREKGEKGQIQQPRKRRVTLSEMFGFGRRKVAPVDDGEGSLQTIVHPLLGQLKSSPTKKKPRRGSI